MTVVAPDPVAAQSHLVAGGIGGLIGMGAGGYGALGVVALRARRGHYLFQLKDAFGWDSAPLLIGGGTGLALGLWDPNRLRNTIVSSAAVAVVGTAIGAVVGHNIWPPPEGKWAGGVIGGGGGVLAGALVGVLLAPDAIWSTDTKTGLPFLIRIPVGDE